LELRGLAAPESLSSVDIVSPLEFLERELRELNPLRKIENTRILKGMHEVGCGDFDGARLF
jgi:hypothetical protein